MYNMYSPNFSFQQQSPQLVRVKGIEGAKQYQLPANSALALFDTDSDIMYIKTTDGAGFPTIRIFDFVLKREEKKDELYITRKLFDEFQKRIEEMTKGVTDDGKLFG